MKTFLLSLAVIALPAFAKTPTPSPSPSVAPDARPVFSETIVVKLTRQQEIQMAAASLLRQADGLWRSFLMVAAALENGIPGDGKQSAISGAELAAAMGTENADKIKAAAKALR